MKVNSINNRDISFNGFYNSSALKKTLAFAENNGALFMSATSLALSGFVRPASILSAPKTDRENKRLACSKSIVSTFLDFIITFAISVPIVNAIGAISKNPQKYLNSETVKYIKQNCKNIEDSRVYTFLNQLFKLGIGLAIAAPKAILNAAGTPYVMNSVFSDTPSDKNKNPVFKGSEENKLAKLMGKFFDNKNVLKFAEKNQNSNYPLHITALKDALTTGVFAAEIGRSNKIKNDRKGPLIYNSILSTILCIASAYGIDSLTKNFDKKFTQKFANANKSDLNLKKYLDGYKIVKPTIIMGILYYLLIPVISTYFAERIDKKLPIKKQ